MKERSVYVYKVLTDAEWANLQAEGHFCGSSDDLRDGFIHLSYAHQVRGTLEKHFSNRTDLILCRLVTEHLGEALKAEVSRGGQAFPHLYRKMLLDDVEEHLLVSDLEMSELDGELLP